MNAPSIDIRDILDADSSLGFTTGTDLFAGSMPDSPDECITTYDTGGPKPNAMIAGDEFARVMIHVRGKKFQYTESYANARTVFGLIHRKANHTVDSSTRIISIKALQSPFFIGYDEKDRPIWSINFEIDLSIT